MYSWWLVPIKKSRWQAQYCHDFYPVYEFTKQVAGDEANVDLLVVLEQSHMIMNLLQRQFATIQDADAFVYENENMETWVPDLLKTLKNKKKL